MSDYREPGATVTQIYSSPSAVSSSADLPACIIGPCWDLKVQAQCEDNYNADPDAGEQTFIWPDKAGIVDLAGTRQTTRKFDDQKIADYPIQIYLEDIIGNISKVTDYAYAIDQDGFMLPSAIVIPKTTGTCAVPYLNTLIGDNNFAADIISGDMINITIDNAAYRGPAISVEDQIVEISDIPESTGTLAVGSTTISLKSAGLWTADHVNKYIRFTSGTNFTYLNPQRKITAYISPNEIICNAFVYTPGLDDFEIITHEDANIQPALEGDMAILGGLCGNFNFAENSVRLSAVFSAIDPEVGDVLRIAVEGDIEVDGQTDTLTISTLTVSTDTFTQQDLGKMIRVGYSIDSPAAPDGDCDTTPGSIIVPRVTATVTHPGSMIFIGTEFRKIIKITGTAPAPQTIQYAGSLITGVNNWEIFNWKFFLITRVESETSVLLNEQCLDPVQAGFLPYMFAQEEEVRVVTSASFANDPYWDLGYDGDNLGGWFVQMLLYKSTVPYTATNDYKVLATYRDQKSVSFSALASASDVTAFVGGSNINNPLGLGVTKARSFVADGQPVYAESVNLWYSAETANYGYPETMTEVDGYAAVLEDIGTKEVYSIVALTQNTTVLDAVVAHCLACSTPTEKRERRTFITRDFDGLELPFGEINSSSGYIDPGYDSANNKIFYDTSAGFITSGITANDKLVILSSDFVGTYYVSSVVSNSAVLLKGDDWDSTPEFATSNIMLDVNDNEIWDYDNTLGNCDIGDYIRIRSGGTDVYRQVTDVTQDVNFGTYLTYQGTSISAGYSEIKTLTTNSLGDSTCDFTWSAPVAPDPEEADNFIGRFILVKDSSTPGNIGIRRKIIDATDNTTYLTLTLDEAIGTALTLNDIVQIMGPAASGNTLGITVYRRISGIKYYLKERTKTAIAEAVKSVAVGYSEKRVTVLFPSVIEDQTRTDENGDPVYTFIPAYYACCSAAGRRQASKAWASMTLEEVGGFRRVRYVDQFFKKEQLNTIASGGWSILSQENDSSPIIYRDMLTSGMSTAEAQEESIVADVDYVSKYLRNMARKNVGKGRKITSTYLMMMTIQINASATKLMEGEYLIAGETWSAWELKYIAQSLADRRNMEVKAKIGVPYCPKQIDITIYI